MDHGSPRLVFLLVAAFTLIAIVTVATRPAARLIGAPSLYGLVKSAELPHVRAARQGRRRSTIAPVLLGDRSTVEHRTLTPAI